jgi:hypothetical protein
MTRARRAALQALGASALAAAVAACSSSVDLRPEAETLAPFVSTVVAMPTSIDWGGLPDQRRIQRRTGDSLLEMTGGRAVIAEELGGQDDSYLQEMLRTLGEDPAHALSFTITVGVGRRLLKGSAPLGGFQASRRLVVDYVARIEVRHIGSPTVIGTVESIETGSPNQPEVGPEGEAQGPMAAIDDALARAVGAFAPALSTTRQRTLIVEVPTAASGGLVRRLEALQQLYPELSEAQMQRLAVSRERFLVVEPGRLAGLGLRAGDLLGVPGGETIASHAALARAVARGRKPLLAIDRNGEHYLLGG